MEERGNLSNFSFPHTDLYGYQQLTGKISLLVGACNGLKYSMALCSIQSTARYHMNTDSFPCEL